MNVVWKDKREVIGKSGDLLLTSLGVASTLRRVKSKAQAL